MTRFIIDHGVPYDLAYLMEDYEILANAIVFAQFHNGGLEWDWDTMRFIEKTP